MRAGGDIKVLTRCVAVCAVAYRDLAEGARHRVETDLLVARNRAECARDVTPPADAGEDSDPAALAVYAELERIEMEIKKRGSAGITASERVDAAERLAKQVR